MIARAETAERRLAIYRGLLRRNRVVGTLRLVVPALGIVALGYFVARMLVASLAAGFSMGHLVLNSGSVIVDTPAYSGVMTTGDVYTVSAQSAETKMTALDVIDLKNARLLLTKPDRTVMTATARLAFFNTITQIITIPATAVVEQSTGNRGVLENVTVNLPAQTLVATGHVHIATPDGMTVDGTGLTYDAKTSQWRFGRSTVNFPDRSDATEDNPAP